MEYLIELCISLGAFHYRVHRTTGELDHYQSMNLRLKNANEKLEKEIAREEEKHRQLVNKQKTLSSKYKAEREEVILYQ